MENIKCVSCGYPNFYEKDENEVLNHPCKKCGEVIGANSGVMGANSPQTKKHKVTCKSCNYSFFDENPAKALTEPCVVCRKIMGAKAPYPYEGIDSAYRPKIIICSNCDKKNDGNRTTCWGCNTRLIVSTPNKNVQRASSPQPVSNKERAPLVKCGKCANNISRWAESCPKCGWVPHRICRICQQEIPHNSKLCPECGDPNPFDGKLNVTTQRFPEKNITTQKSTPIGNNHDIKKTKTFFSWKIFIVSFILAALLNQIISGIAGVEPHKNIAWTAAWIYLSIAAWKYWKWKALLPYPAFLILIMIIQAFFSSTGEGRLSLAYLTISAVLNIGGIIVYYLLITKTSITDNKKTTL